MIGRDLLPLLTTLHHAGLLTPQDCQRVVERAEELHHPPLEALLELGLVGEVRLAQFFQSKLMIPEVDAAMLARLDLDTVALIPGELAWERCVLPVSIDDAGNLTVAMADPTDTAAVEAVADQAQAYIIRAVAPLYALREAIYRYYGPRQGERRRTPVSIQPLQTAPNPVGSGVAPLSKGALATFIAQQAAATHGEQVLEHLLEFLAAGFGRVIVFVHRQGQLRGHMARGADLLREAVVQVRIPMDAPSVFATAMAHRSAHFGPWPTVEAIDAALAGALGGIDGTALVLPILVGERIPAVVFAAEPQVALDPRVLPDLVDHTGRALARVIVRARQGA